MCKKLILILFVLGSIKTASTVPIDGDVDATGYVKAGTDLRASSNMWINNMLLVGPDGQVSSDRMSNIWSVITPLMYTSSVHTASISTNSGNIGSLQGSVSSLSNSAQNSLLTNQSQSDTLRIHTASITTNSGNINSLQGSVSSLSNSAQTTKTDITHLENRADQNDVRDAEDTLMADYSRRVVWNDGFADQFNDETGISKTGTATTARYAVGYYTAPLNPGFGSGVDGNFTIGSGSNMFSTDVYGTANHGYSPYSSMPITNIYAGSNWLETATPPLGITNGDEVAIISLQGFHSAVGTTNGAHYAHVGKYELANVSSIIGNRVTLNIFLTNTYWESNIWKTTANSNFYKVAICRVGQWQDLQIPAGATNTVALWDGFQTTNKWGQINPGVMFMRARNLNVSGLLNAWGSGYRPSEAGSLAEGLWGYVAPSIAASFLDSPYYAAGGGYAVTGSCYSSQSTPMTFTKGDVACSTLHMGGGGFWAVSKFKQSGGILWIYAETTSVTGLISVGNAFNVNGEANIGAAGTLVLGMQTNGFMNLNSLCASGGWYWNWGDVYGSGGRVRLDYNTAQTNWVSGVGGASTQNPATRGTVSLGGTPLFDSSFQIKSVNYNINLVPTNGYFGVVDRGTAGALSYSVLDGTVWRSVVPVLSEAWGIAGWSYRTGTYSVCGSTGRVWKCNSTGDVNAAVHAVTIIEKE